MIDITREIIHNCGSIIIHPKGRSMLPFIKEGDSVTVSYMSKRAKKFDIVLYKSHGFYVLHRVSGYSDNGYIIFGDNSNIKEYIDYDDVLGKVSYIKRNKRKIYVNKGMFACAVRVWYCLGFKKFAMKIKMIKRCFY